MSAAIDWWRGRSRREQWMLGILAAIALPVLVWLLVVRPLDAAHRDALDDYRMALDRNGRISALAAARAGAPEGKTLIVDGPLSVYVADSAAQRGLDLSRNLDAPSGGVEIAVDQARPEAALAWLGQLEQDGLSVSSVSLSPGPDGGATLTATLESRAR
ncbi:type II secretion system protein GspM [Sphingomicrobium nitratireducens]|uniref:type II secretion system protein GspM n=1 Tax=Sphingomicrobium nitratireducens TaxID=2964666 RepID=UPI002240CA5C|nr:type II secretion system protein GspM [Sphingomicrobium nitratireducens]